MPGKYFTLDSSDGLRRVAQISSRTAESIKERRPHYPTSRERIIRSFLGRSGLPPTYTPDDAQAIRSDWDEVNRDFEQGGTDE